MEDVVDGVSCERVAQDFLDDDPEDAESYQPSCFQQPESSEEEVHTNFVAMFNFPDRFESSERNPLSDHMLYTGNTF
jgi:hypothetical protein